MSLALLGSTSTSRSYLFGWLLSAASDDELRRAEACLCDSPTAISDPDERAALRDFIRAELTESYRRDRAPRGISGEWYENRVNLAALVEWLASRGEPIDDIPYLLEKPWKYWAEYAEMRAGEGA